MTAEMHTDPNQRDVSRALICALFHHPRLLDQILEETGLAPHHLAMWARQRGTPDIEKLAGWLSVGQQPGRYKPLLEVAASQLRAGDLAEALPVFRWAYRTWLLGSRAQPASPREGAKLLALWGECLYRLGRPDEAQQRWLLALDLVSEQETLRRLIQTMERAGGAQACAAVLDEAVRRRLPGAEALWQRRERLALAQGRPLSTVEPGRVLAALPQGPGAPQVAVMADVANLDMVCGEQYGYDRRLDYRRLLATAERHGPVRVKAAFVPDVPETLPVRRHLEGAGFEIDLKRPKRSHGRMVANADTAMAAAAVRWASEPQIGRVELWTGDGDFCKVRQVVAQAWPDVAVAFRSFELGTALAIRQLGADWEPIDATYVRSTRA